MFSFHKKRCSWSLVASGASIVILISIVHLFLYPVVPSLDYFSTWSFQNSCVPINGSSAVDNRASQDNKTIKDRMYMTFVNETSKGSPPPMLDLNAEFPEDLHNAVVYRGAPWKAEIGRWLAGCDARNASVKIVEVITSLIFEIYFYHVLFLTYQSSFHVYTHILLYFSFHFQSFNGVNHFIVRSESIYKVSSALQVLHDSSS